MELLARSQVQTTPNLANVSKYGPLAVAFRSAAVISARDSEDDSSTHPYHAVKWPSVSLTCLIYSDTIAPADRAAHTLLTHAPLIRAL